MRENKKEEEERIEKRIRGKDDREQQERQRLTKEEVE